jgi:hypothetical protein
MRTSLNLKPILLATSFSPEALAQVTPYAPEEVPSITIFPRYPIAGSSVSTTLYRNTCKANVPGEDLVTFPYVKPVRIGNSFEVAEAPFGFNPLCFGPPLGEGSSARSYLLGSLDSGRYSVTLTGRPGDFSPNPNTPRDTVATLTLDFTVLSIAQAQRATLEIPAAGSTQSGIGVVSGWACVADRVEMSINGGAKVKLSGESPRADVEPVCGHGTAGFGTLLNFNNLGAGSHTIQLFVKGVPIGEPTRFNVVLPAGEFARGLRKEVSVPDFPAAGKTTVIDWREAEQNFGVREVK